jgi:Tfp pilus assembly protein PilP
MRKIIIILILLISIVGCGRKEEVEIKPMVRPPMPVIEIPEVKVEVTPYEYIPADRRDPFVPLIKPEVEKKEITKPEVKPIEEKIEEIYELDINSLTLSGLIWNGGEALALFHDGGGFGYILKKGLLYGANFEPIKGISGLIKDNKVTLYQGKRKLIFAFEEEKFEIVKISKEKKKGGEI